MTPEEIERLRKAIEPGWNDESGRPLYPPAAAKPDLRALLADWEERGREIKRLRRELNEFTVMMQRIAEDVLPDPVRYADLTPEMVRDGFIKAWYERGREIERLRASTLPDVVPEDVDALKAEIERLRKAHEALLNTLGASKHPWIAKVHKNAAAHYAVLRGEGEK